MMSILKKIFEYMPEIIFVDKKPRNNMKALYGTRSLSFDFYSVVIVS